MMMAKRTSGLGDIWAFIWIALAAPAACIIGLAMSACGAFVGPATKLDDTYFFQCGDVRCRLGWEECSSGKPRLCIPAMAGARHTDGGR